MKRMHLILAGYAVSMAAACASSTDNPEAALSETWDSWDKADKQTPSCSASECFDIKSGKDISFIAVLAEKCEGATITLELFDRDGKEVKKSPSPHGQGKPCEKAGITIDPKALKFDGLKDNRYTLCVHYDGVATTGDIIVTAKAGQACWEEEVHGDCEPCPPPKKDKKGDKDGKWRKDGKYGL